MNKTAIKNFAIWARNKLIADITYKAGLLGITDKEIKAHLPQSTKDVQFFDIGTKEPYSISGEEIKQRDKLVELISSKSRQADYTTAYKSVVEEVAYTWFNRLIAIRFMEVNDYLPSRIRVLSSESKAKIEPDLVTRPFESELEFTPFEKDQIIKLTHDSKLDELFRMLFTKQCNALNGILPHLFEKTSDYTELLLNVSFTDRDGVVYHLANDIDEDDFKEAIEIIGWLYQYYNTEPKDEAFALLKRNVKITKERIPAVTQLFTPDWIVRYMVENSLGKLWLEGHPNDALKSQWKYYLEEAKQNESVKGELEKTRAEYKQINLEDIKFIDPCMGSGHILVYAFDVLMEIYESQGYTQRDAAGAIVENNLYGLDIDDRAHQLAYFAVMMKARKYDRRFLTRETSPKLYSIKESNNINKEHLKYFGQSLNDMERNLAIQQTEYLLDVLKDAKEYGSILSIDSCNWELLNCFVADYYIEGQMGLESIGIEYSQEKLKEIISFAEVMAQKYDVVVTNPPYMGSNGMSGKLSDYTKLYFPDSKSDFFSVFIEKCEWYAKRNAYYAMITQPSFLFLSSFEKLRSKIINQHTISSLLHMGRGIFGIDFGSTAFVINKNYYSGYNGCYFKLHERTFQYINPDDISQLYLMSKGNADVRYNFSEYNTKNDTKMDQEDIDSSCGKELQLYYETNQNDFLKIPGSPIAYWVSNNLMNVYLKSKTLGEIAAPRKGNSTSDNNRFLRLWFEVANEKINLRATEIIRSDSMKKRWYPYNKGGGYRKWYGFNEYLVDWYNDAEAIRNIKTAVIANYQYFMQPGLTWSTVSSNNFSIRWFDEGFIFDNGGCSIFELGNKRAYLIALLNSSVFKFIFGQLNPTLNFQSGEVAKFPVLIEKNERIDELSINNVKLAKYDWDVFETSWDFTSHPMVNSALTIEQAYLIWNIDCFERFKTLKANEEELNRIFIDLYGLQDELTPEVEDKDITVRKADIQRDIKSFISYAVGCMFGRYSLNEKGIIYAGGKWDYSQYGTFVPDKDNILPITDEEYFEDDIVGLFIAFVKEVYGTETLEENLDFIAKELGNKGNTAREIIRNYFVKEFFKDHCKVYQKRPIYWLFDSGKSDGFKALIYMHRYDENTIGNLRIDYLHKMQRVYDSEISRMQESIDNSSDGREVSTAQKRKEKLIKQLKETKEYDEKIAHLALARISIDLDEGVKVNYEKVQTDSDGKKLDVLAKI